MASVAEKPNLESTVDAVEWKTVQDSNAPLFSRFERIATAAEVVGDAFAAAFGITISYLIYHSLDLGKHIVYPPGLMLGGAFLYAVLFVIMLDRDGAYREGHGLLRIKETERALRVSAQSLLLVLPVSFLSARLVSRWVCLFALVMVPLAVITEKQLFFLAIRALHAYGIGIRRVLIYGAGFTGRRIFSALTRSPKLGLRPVAIIDESDEMTGQVIHGFGYRREHSVPVAVAPITPELIRSYSADMVIAAIPSLGREKFNAAFSATVDAGAKFAYVPGQSLFPEAWVDYADIDGVMIASLARPAGRALYQSSKRALDVAVSSALIVVSSPLLLAIAIAVRLDSRGPVIFRQQRVGKNGELFSMYKFRSMRVDAPQYDYSPAQTEDPRITRVGRYIRKTSFDEIPQLLNVLRGEMSLVGPRPEMPFIVEEYGTRERQRLSVLPGITGLWQLSADRAYPIHESIHYDLYYIRDRGFFMDLAILFHTLLFAMKGI